MRQSAERQRLHCPDFFPRLIPGTSIVVQQDYLFDSWNAWLHLTMERLSEYFEILTDTGLGSVVYLNMRAIPEAEIAAAAVGQMSAAEKLRLLEHARHRFTGHQALMLERSHASYLRGPAWCTGVDVEGHLAAFVRVVDAELVRLRPLAEPDLADEIDELRRALGAGHDLASLQSHLDRPGARLEAAATRGFAGRLPFRLFGLPQPITRRRLLARRVGTMLRIGKSHLARALSAGRLARAGVSR